MAISGLTNTLPRSSCGKCVQVLKDLLSGLNDEEQVEKQRTEPPPLTLLRAIARSSNDHPWHDQWGQELPHAKQHGRRYKTGESNSSKSLAESISKAISQHEKNQEPKSQRQHPLLKIEETEDGVRLTIPVETTAPALMKEWKHLEPPTGNGEAKKSNGNDNDNDNHLDEWIPLATSVRRDDEETHNVSKVEKPLTIELKCRQCETTGPEAGARAFLMGPEPLSIVLCHNRIHSDRQEVEEILTHELIHLYDVQTLKLDLSDCETVAYSEVRAAREAECMDTKQALEQAESMVSQFTQTLEKHVYKPYCVRSIALGATRNMFPSRGTSCLNKVWEQAYQDHRPFGRNQEPTKQKASHKESSGTVDGMSGK